MISRWVLNRRATGWTQKKEAGVSFFCHYYQKNSKKQELLRQILCRKSRIRLLKMAFISGISLAGCFLLCQTQTLR